MNEQRDEKKPTKPLAEMTQVERTRWAFDRLHLVIEEHRDAEEQRDAYLALGILLGEAAP